MNAVRFGPGIFSAETFCRCAAFVVHLLLLPTTANKYTTAMASAKETKHEEDATAGASGGAGAGPTAGERPAAQTEVLTWGCGNDGQLGLGREWVGRSAMLPQVVPTFSQHGITITKVRYSGASLLGPVLTKHAGPGARHQVSAGSRHVIALDSAGNAYAWGWGQVCHFSWACGSFSAEAPCAGVGSADNWGWAC